jgi:hypothetical protein
VRGETDHHEQRHVEDQDARQDQCIVVVGEPDQALRQADGRDDHPGLPLLAVEGREQQREEQQRSKAR